jgi:putative SOS response-associated peptidase YedK
LSRADFLEYLQIKKDLTEIKSQLHRPAQYAYNYGNWPIIRAIKGLKDYEITFMDWEFRPSWIKNMDEMKLVRKGINPQTMVQGKPIPYFNTTAEKLLTSSMWKESAKERRCIVPSEYFFEWRHHFPIGKKGQVLKTAVRYPYVIRPIDEKPAYMIGIWTPWYDNLTKQWYDTFSNITTEPPLGHPMRMIHNSKNRMPVYHTEEMAEAWLWGNLTDADIKVFGSYVWPADKLQYNTVDKDFLKLEEPLTAATYPELDEPHVTPTPSTSQTDLFA